MPSTLDRLIYVDDSGHPQTGTVVFGWIEFSPDRWNSILGTWLDTRRRLWRDFGVPVTEELHTTEYVNGRGRISTRPPSKFVDDDAVHLDSQHSQLIQMADLIAWCANTHIAPHPKNKFAQRWYTDHLATRDPAREPQEI